MRGGRRTRGVARPCCVRSTDERARLPALTIAPDQTGLRATLTLDGPPHRAPALVATLAPGPRYRMRWAGAIIPFAEPLPGVLEIGLPPGTTGGTLAIDTAG